MTKALEIYDSMEASQGDARQSWHAPGLGDGPDDRQDCRHAAGQACPAPDGVPSDCVSGPGACPLALADEGVWLRVVALRSGRSAHHRLIDMGITVGARVRILKRGGGCPMLLGVGDGRLALGQGLAGKILVEPANDDIDGRGNA